MPNLKWYHDDHHHNVHFARVSGLAGLVVGIARLDKKYVLLDEDMCRRWYALRRAEKFQLLKGHRRFPDKESAMAAMRLIYG